MLLAERREAMQKIAAENSEPPFKESNPEEQRDPQNSKEHDSSIEGNVLSDSDTKTVKACLQTAQNEDQEFYEKLLQLGSAKQIGLFKQIDMDVQRTHPPRYEKLFDSPRISFV